MSELSVYKRPLADGVEVSDEMTAGVPWLQTAPLVAALDAIIIVCATMLTGAIYAETFYEGAEPIWPLVNIGLIVSALFVTVMTNRGGYGYSAYTDRSRSFSSVLISWNVACLLLALTLFLTKAGSDVSRGASILLYVTGLAALAISRKFLTGILIEASKAGRLTARRIFLVGRAGDVADFVRREKPSSRGLAVAGTALMSPGRDADAAAWIRQAIDKAREVEPDDVVLVMPWNEEKLLVEIADAFKVLPVTVAVAAPGLFERYERVPFADTGLCSFVLAPAPLSAFELTAKRLLDISVATLALTLLLPAFALVGALIKCDSKGPVFFRQKRNGFNQNVFWIYKFRTMRVQEDGVTAFSQARRGDPRITRIGEFLRKTSIDELPQLINVLLGQMSIVGPRPHAVAHNDAFADRIALYARRHNVKPGITGWAQVHGHRGETDTEQKMRSRVEHDLFYLDNWSLLLDLRIMFMTVWALISNRNVH